jgi:hypothetical protein
MNKRLVVSKRAGIAHDESAEVAEPYKAALDNLTILVASPQPFAQQVTVVTFVDNHPRRLLSPDARGGAAY